MRDLLPAVVAVGLVLAGAAALADAATALSC